MPGTSTDFIVRGMASPLANELQFQIDNAGSRSDVRLIALGMPAAAATEVVRLMPKPANYLTQTVPNLAALGVPHLLATQILANIG